MQCHLYDNVEVHNFTEPHRNIVKYLENELVSKLYGQSSL
jgi:hypothetical protein